MIDQERLFLVVSMLLLSGRSKRNESKIAGLPQFF